MNDAAPLTEADLFRSYWDDGLLDLFCGLAVLLIGLGWALGQVALAAVQAPCWIFLWAPVRRLVVEPHAGYVSFSRSRRDRTVRKLWGTAGTGLAMLVLTVALVVVVRTRGEVPVLRSLSPGLPAVLLAVPALLVGLVTGVRRFGLYALVLVAGAILAAAFAWEPEVPMAAGGLVAAVTGAVLLTRFLRAGRAYRETR